MNRTIDRVPPALVDEVFFCLARPARRFVLSCVTNNRSRSVCRDELDTAFVGWYTQKPPNEMSTTDYRAAITALRHVHLPALVDTGFVREVDNLIVSNGHPALLDPGIKSAITSVESDGTGPVFEALADGERRSILDVLTHQYRPMHVEELAQELAARLTTSTDPAAHERIQIRLHHQQLPKLAALGLISYDRERDLVGYQGSPAVRIPWIHSYLGPDFRSAVSDGAEPVASIEGREQVVSCGQSMLDDAREEVFMVFTATGLLEAGCFAELTEAVERGVDVYLGTTDPVVREYIETTLPDVILWEPRQEWAEIPVVEESVGRLIVVDRKMAMVGTLCTPEGERTAEERAIIASGADNILVVLLRQLVDGQRQSLEQATAENPVPMLF